MERLITNKILNWSKKKDVLPLFVLGARQIGKTYSVLDFANRYYAKKYIYLNFLDTTKDYEILKNTTNPHEIITALEILNDVKIDNDWLVIFDEIQAMTNIRSSLKHFVEQKLGYKIICLGSYLGNLVNDQTSFPVGKIETINMFPMNFEEFLMAYNKQDLIIEIKKSLKEMKPISKPIDDYLNQLLKEFLLVGGMPKAVDEYFKNKNIYDAFAINVKLIDDYKYDIVKYIISNNDKVKCSTIYENIPMFLAKQNKKFMLSNIDKNARYRGYEIALKNLITTNIVYKINNLNTFSSPGSLHQKESEFKIYYNNPGFISTIFNLSNEILFNNNQYCNVRGSIFENYILCELSQKIGMNNIFYYSFLDDNNNLYEVDFCIENLSGNLIPIEVKSSKDFRTKSLNKLLSINDKSIEYSIIFSFKNFLFDKENKIYKLPLYSIGFLEFENNRIKLNH